MCAETSTLSYCPINIFSYYFPNNQEIKLDGMKVLLTKKFNGIISIYLKEGIVGVYAGNPPRGRNGGRFFGRRNRET